MKTRNIMKRMIAPFIAAMALILATMYGAKEVSAANNVSISLSCAGETTKAYNVDPSFKIVASDDWIVVRKTAQDKFTITVTANTGCTSRTGYVRTYKNGQTSVVDQFTVTQWGSGHNYVTVRAVNPTCSSFGRDDTKCTKCGNVSATNQIPKTGHVTVYQSRVNPTCTAQGYDIYKCKYCSYTEKKNYQKAKGHTYKVVRDVEPTCTKEGHEYNQCTVCNYKTSGASIPKIAHVTAYQSRVNPTCTAQGYDIYKCKYCSYTEKKNYQKAKGHTYKVVRDVEPTCTKEGHEYNQCTVCNYKTSGASLPKIAHVTAYQSRVNPTCTAKGYDVYKCKNCTYTEKKNYKDAKGHTYKVVRDVEPTCTKLGHEYNQCTVCSYKTDGASIPMIEHTWKVEKKAATYTTEGYEKKYCSVCKKEEYNKKIAKLETTVNFLDGGKVVSTKKVTYGSTFGNLPTPTRSGDCQFLGWFQGTNGGIEVKSSDTVKETSGTVTLYAHWLIRVEEFVDGAGGSLTFSANDFGTDWKCFFTTNKWAPVNEGCSWIKSGPSYNSSTKKVTVSCETNTSSANRYTLLYAYETKTAKAIEYKIVQKPVPTYSITLNVNGGDEGSVPSSLTKTHGEDIDL